MNAHLYLFDAVILHMLHSIMQEFIVIAVPGFGDFFHFVQQIAGRCNKAVNEQNPIADARLLDGSRVCATIPPVSPHGATLTIRKFQNERMTHSEYVRLNSISREGMEILKLFVELLDGLFINYL